MNASGSPRGPMNDSSANAQPTAREYEQELNGIRGSLLRMAGRVEQMIGEAGRALVQRDVDLALATIAALAVVLALFR